MPLVIPPGKIDVGFCFKDCLVLLLEVPLVVLPLADLPEKEAQRLAATFTKRRNGEWFEYNSELITWIKSLPATTSKWAGFEFRPIPKMKGESVRVNISIDQVILRAGQKLALDQGISFSALISQLVRENQAKG